MEKSLKLLKIELQYVKDNLKYLESNIHTYSCMIHGPELVESTKELCKESIKFLELEIATREYF